jgi:hypothetical protein
MPSVDMTAEVTSSLKISVRHPAFPWRGCSGRDGASTIRRLSLRISVDGLPPDWRPSGAGLGLGTRMPVGLVTPTRVAPHRGGVSADPRGKLAPVCGQWPSVWWTDGVTVTSLAMAHLKPTSSRAIATTTWFACLPRARSVRSRWHSRTCAFQLIAWMTWGGVASRRCNGRLTLAGYR